MDSFDVIIIDTPASLGLLTVNALCAAGRSNTNPSRVLCSGRNGAVDIPCQRCAEVSKPKSRIARYSDDDGYKQGANYAKRSLSKLETLSETGYSILIFQDLYLSRSPP